MHLAVRRRMNFIGFNKHKKTGLHSTVSRSLRQLFSPKIGKVRTAKNWKGKNRKPRQTFSRTRFNTAQQMHLLSFSPAHRNIFRRFRFSSAKSTTATAPRFPWSAVNPEQARSGRFSAAPFSLLRSRRVIPAQPSLLRSSPLTILDLRAFNPATAVISRHKLLRVSAPTLSIFIVGSGRFVVNKSYHSVLPYPHTLRSRWNHACWVVGPLAIRALTTSPSETGSEL